LIENRGLEGRSNLEVFQSRPHPEERPKGASRRTRAAEVAAIPSPFETRASPAPQGEGTEGARVASGAGEGEGEAEPPVSRS
jgi:hypothetical protein